MRSWCGVRFTLKDAELDLGLLQDGVRNCVLFPQPNDTYLKVPGECPRVGAPGVERGFTLCREQLQVSGSAASLCVGVGWGSPTESGSLGRTGDSCPSLGGLGWAGLVCCCQQSSWPAHGRCLLVLGSGRMVMMRTSGFEVVMAVYVCPCASVGGSVIPDFI